ncbi:prephenate dehydratase [Butyrivibrio sp. NC3005]|uniref:prephenate dehydratase n=1 Tax=Butyrivibrio sp. NC3005 TaxID=1280685 RepID=UPI00040ABF7D|nr:prephenate dehydratase [Butyrivibrio sp. NC3005]
MDLKELRAKLDEIDPKIVELFEQRMELCSQVADYKISAGKKVFDPAREKEKIQAVKSLTHNDFNATGVEELFEQLMSMSRKLQYQKLSETGALGRLPFIEVDSLKKEGSRVVFQGAEGAYSQAAMFKFFGEDVNNFHVDTFRDAMVAIEDGAADFAVLPIENSTAGIVTDIYDLLNEYENFIVGEQIIPIEHCLIGVPGTNISDIKTVYSHAQSLMQSSRFLNDHPDWRQISMKNNAFAVQKIANDKDKTQAAIASEYAAKFYNMEILQKKINHSDTNSTRFIIVTNQKIYLPDAGKISLLVEIRDEVGSLYHILSHFIYNHVNLTRIESRPIEDRNWEYRFFIDFEGNLADSAVKNVLRGLREECKSLRVLGNY